MFTGTGLAATLEDLRTLDALARTDTALARRDPRAKLITTLLFIVTVVSFDRYRVAALLPLLLYPAVLAVQGALPWRSLWRVLWLASPFALAVGFFNPLIDRSPMLWLAGQEISAGWVSFASIGLRFTLTTTAAMVLVAGTGMPAICAALHWLKLPRVFTVQLLFLHRYLFVLAEEALRMQTARMLRAGNRPRLALPVYASLLGHLLLRAFGRAQRIHHAMLARGFDGELRLTRGWRWNAADTLFVLGWCGLFALARLLDPLAAWAALVSGATR